jgi:hypothetical protein
MTSAPPVLHTADTIEVDDGTQAESVGRQSADPGAATVGYCGGRVPPVLAVGAGGQARAAARAPDCSVP